MTTKTLSITVAGAGFKQNPGKLVIGEAIYLKRNPNNPVDCNAIEVHIVSGERAGYIPKEIAYSMSPAIRDGKLKIIKCIVESKKIIQVLYEEEH